MGKKLSKNVPVIAISPPIDCPVDKSSQTPINVSKSVSTVEAGPSGDCAKEEGALSPTDTQKRVDAKAQKPPRPKRTIVPRHRILLLQRDTEILSEVKGLSTFMNFGDDSDLQRRFWAPEKYVEVYRNKKDRRLESIARLSNCRISLTSQIKKNHVGDIGQILIVQASTPVGLDRCLNLLAEKFPALQMKL